MQAIRIVVILVAVMAWPSAGRGSGTGGVVVSIKPLHSLVAAVMEGVGAPYLIVDGAQSPHRFTMKPSDATALEQAELVFWIGNALEVFLEKPMATLAGGAKIVTLKETPGLISRKRRDDGTFEARESDVSGDLHRDGEPATGNGGAHLPGDDGDDDMHLWLDPVNAQALVRGIVQALVDADRKNTARYAANARALQSELADLVPEIATMLSPVAGRPFVVFHDAYQYFEKRFGFNAVGSVTINPAVLPGAGRIRTIRNKIAELGAVCVFAEPQFDPRLVQVVTSGTQAVAGILDPLGASLARGPRQYVQLIRDMAVSFVDCLARR